MTKFSKVSCHILDEDSTLIVVATRVGRLYYLDCELCNHVGLAEKNHGQVQKKGELCVQVDGAAVMVCTPPDGA